MSILLGKILFKTVLITAGLVCVYCGIKKFVDYPFGGGSLVILGVITTILSIGLAFFY